jgi:hypothetical protein
MKRMIPVVDLGTGQISFRPADTRTLDVPSNFDRQTAGASLDAWSRARYQSVEGKSLLCAAFLRPLSWRVYGEECLVADDASPATAAQPASYTLSAIEPQR